MYSEFKSDQRNLHIITFVLSKKAVKLIQSNYTLRKSNHITSCWCRTPCFCWACRFILATCNCPSLSAKSSFNCCILLLCSSMSSRSFFTNSSFSSTWKSNVQLKPTFLHKYQLTIWSHYIAIWSQCQMDRKPCLNNEIHVQITECMCCWTWFLLKNPPARLSLVYVTL